MRKRTLVQVNACACVYARRLHDMRASNAYLHTFSLLCLVVKADQRGRPGWITIPAAPRKKHLVETDQAEQESVKGLCSDCRNYVREYAWTSPTAAHVAVKDCYVVGG